MPKVCPLLVTLFIGGCADESNFFDRHTHWQFTVALASQEVPASAGNLDSAPLEPGVAWVTLGHWNTIFYPLVNPSGGDRVQLLSPFGHDPSLGAYTDYVLRNDGCTPQCCGANASVTLYEAVVAPADRRVDSDLDMGGGIEVCVDGPDECQSPTTVEVWRVGCFLEPTSTCQNEILNADGEGTYAVGPFRLTLTVDTDGCPVPD